MMDPLVTIIMPAYNSANSIEQTIASVLNQTYQHWLLIVVDDCSTDNTVDVVSCHLKDERIKLISMSENGGPSAARSMAEKYVLPGYVAYIDSDDCWDKNKLADQVDFMITSDLDLCFHKYLINSKGTVAESNDLPRLLTEHDLYTRRGYGFCLTSMLKSSLLKKVSFADSKTLPIAEDFAFFVRLASQAERIGFINKPMAVYNVQPVSRSSNRMKSALTIFPLYIKRYPVKGLFYWMLYLYRVSFVYKK